MFARANVRFAQFIGRTVTSLLSAHINRIRPSVIHTSADVRIAMSLGTSSFGIKKNRAKTVAWRFRSSSGPVMRRMHIARRSIPSLSLDVDSDRLPRRDDRVVWCDVALLSRKQPGAARLAFGRKAPNASTPPLRWVVEGNRDDS
jgi:hypothetical protein